MSPPLVSIQRRPVDEWRCVYCHESIPEAPLICRSCHAMLHVECAEEIEGECVTPGCPGPLPTAARLLEEPAPPGPPLFRPMRPLDWLAAGVIALSLGSLCGWFLFRG